MDENNINKLIGYAIMAIIAFYLVQMIMPLLIWGMVGMVAWRVYIELQKHKH